LKHHLPGDDGLLVVGQGTKAVSSEGSVAITPIAEYRGAVIIEREGNKKAVWQGQEYRTDGYVYLIFRPGTTDDFFAEYGGGEEAPETTDGHLAFLPLSNERAAKELLDSIPDPTEYFVPHREVCRLLGVAPKENIRWDWDEDQGVFVRGED
jgi:hypothetical protein